MHDDRAITAERLFRVASQRIDPVLTGDAVPLTVTRWEVSGEPVPVADAVAADFEPFEIGGRFGRPWGTTWFRMTGTVPEAWSGLDVVADIDLGFRRSPGFQSEGLAWVERDGSWQPWRGLHPLNHHLPMGFPVVGGERLDVLVEAASNPEIGTLGDPNSDLLTAGDRPVYALASAHLTVRNTQVVALRADIRALEGLRQQLPTDDPRHHEILLALRRMLDVLDLEDVPGSAAAGRAELAAALALPAAASAHRISAIGHAHIDSAWLWPVRETRRKCSRTFSNALALMDDEPEFMFACSQAQQYDWMRTGYPTIFEGIRRKVADGQWVPVGSMWVEADTNLAGGEALIRQITHGQRFFEEHFGVTCTEVWLPDVFGYPASLPQIMTVCGIDRFLTQKLSWNRTNRFPHHSFWWEGIDGSTVFTHFPPVETYNSTMEANELAHAVRTFTDKGPSTRSLLPFGWGDGGGGPTAQMMDQYHRARDLDGSPRLTIEAPEAFFDAAIAEYADAPRWVGELYFEMHRGTFTSQAGTKLGNRRCEELLREAEAWLVASGETDPATAERLDELWKHVLLLQFHDILPGSSIGWVHREAVEDYTAIRAELLELIERTAGRITGGHAGWINPTPFAHHGVVIDDGAADPGRVQVLADGTGAAWLDTDAWTVSAAPATPLPDGTPPVVVRRDGTRIELSNGLVRAAIDEHGHLVSFIDDTTGREFVAAGESAGVLQLHPDLPNVYDAWDIEDFDLRRFTVIDAVDAVDVTDDGPLVARVVVGRTFGPSSVTQTIELRAGSPRLNVHVEADWHHQERLLKVAFPFDVQTDEITREIQFGNLTTPIHRNTSWDDARFEFCAHRWVHVHETGAGIALLNDSKYGHDALRTRSQLDDGSEVPTTTVRLSLLRGAKYPDPVQDQGHHEFTYSLLPTAGRLDDGRIVQEGYQLNQPVRRLAANADTAADTPVASSTVVTSDRPTVVVETVKPADDGSGEVIIRCYEAAGGRADATLRLGVPASSVRIVDARERPLPGHDWLPVSDGQVPVTLRPFQIQTLAVRR